MNGQRGSTITRATLEALGRSIVSGGYPQAGMAVTEAKLCAHFGVARGSLREAVGLLHQKGLVDRSPRLGVWVLPESRWNMLDSDILRWLLDCPVSPVIVTELNQIRSAFQPSAARLAAQVTDRSAHSIVSHALERLLEAGSNPDVTNQIIRLHTAILQATQNRFLAHLSDIVGVAIRLADRHSRGNLDSTALNARCLPAIAKSILQGDAQTAEQAMRALIEAERSLLGSSTNN